MTARFRSDVRRRLRGDLVVTVGGDGTLLDAAGWVRDEPPVNARRAAEFDQRYVKRMQSALTLEDLCTNVIEALGRTNQLDDTYLIFTSDNGFQLGLHRIRETKGTPYVESHEVPFVLEDGQRVGRLVYERLIARPDRLYGEALGSSYQRQGLALSKHFKPA